ncbi:hypothetical protein IQ13_2717 [Lacibacter cauensis]|uniref:Uncharacterized protein n=1 Tax=Lacibacter cauensis TaxID=510947 RepID=A0A562SKK6_9BACT|nr:hypothetical protein [Lacibacter cauensis]TWI81698.1 hypothetical protein IQ13_2717 [Lacibacter cauensis]
MATLIKTKNDTIKHLEDKVRDGQIILSKCHNLRNQNEYEKLLDEHEIWWKSSGNLLKQLFSDDEISKDFLDVGFISFDPNESFQDKVSAFSQSTYSDIEKLKTIIKDVTNDLYSSQTNSQSTNKNKWERSHKIALASLVVAIVVLIFGNNLYDRLTKPSEKQNQVDDTTSTILSIDTTAIVKQLPYLENYPIIDKGLYVKYYYNNLVFGGVNVDSIQINARTASSEPLEITKEKNFFSMDITEEPFIEFEYKGKYYSIDLTGRHYDFKMTLREIAKPTMTLKKYNEL